MKTTLNILLIAIFALTVTAADKGAAPAPNAYPQEGVWKPISAALGALPIPKAALNAITLRISGANYEVSVLGEKRPDKGTHVLDESAMPKRMTITSTNGPNKGKTFLTIYEVKDANSFRVCYDLTGTAFPEEFEASAENGYYLVEYRRAPDKPTAKATDAAEDAKRQNGAWKPAGAMRAGQRLTRDEMKKITLILRDGAYELVVDGESQTEKGTVLLDTSVMPKRMSFRVEEGPNKGRTIHAIYEMGQTEEGADTFRICYDLSGKGFPTEFKSLKGSTYYLAGYRRQEGSAAVVPER